MSLVTLNPNDEIDAEGTVFGAATGPRTIGDVLGTDGDMLPLYRGGMLHTVEDQPVIADADGSGAV